MRTPFSRSAKVPKAHLIGPEWVIGHPRNNCSGQVPHGLAGCLLGRQCSGLRCYVPTGWAGLRVACTQPQGHRGEHIKENQ